MGFSIKTDLRGFRDEARALSFMARGLPGIEKKWTKEVWWVAKKKAAKRGRGTTQSKGQWNRIAATIKKVGNRVIVTDDLGNMHENKTRDINAKAGGWMPIWFKHENRGKGNGTIRSKKGNLLIVKFNKGYNDFEPLAVLKKKISIKPRPWLPTQKQIFKAGERVLNRELRFAKLGYR